MKIWGSRARKTKPRLRLIAEKGPIQAKGLKSEWGLYGTAVSHWIKPRVSEGTLQWCDKDGNLFADDKVLNTAKRAGNAFIKATDTPPSSSSVGLPTPYELTGDHAWDTDGELLKRYDLQLKSRPVSTCVNEVFTPGVDTQVSAQHIDNTDDTVAEGEGVNVLTPKSSEEETEDMNALDTKPFDKIDFFEGEFSF